jgi:hypothetical protein
MLASLVLFLLRFATLSFNSLTLLLLTPVILDLTLLLSLTLLLLPRLVSLLDLFATLTSPIAAILNRLLRLALTLLGLSRHRSRTLRTLRWLLSLNRLLNRTLLTILLFIFLALLTSLAAVLPIFPSSALSAGIRSESENARTSDRYRKSDSTYVLFLHFSSSGIRSPRRELGLRACCCKRCSRVKSGM